MTYRVQCDFWQLARTIETTVTIEADSPEHAEKIFRANEHGEWDRAFLTVKHIRQFYRRPSLKCNYTFTIEKE